MSRELRSLKSLGDVNAATKGKRYSRRLIDRENQSECRRSKRTAAVNARRGILLNKSNTGNDDELSDDEESVDESIDAVVVPSRRHNRRKRTQTEKQRKATRANLAIGQAILLVEQNIGRGGLQHAQVIGTMISNPSHVMHDGRRFGDVLVAVRVGGEYVERVALLDPALFAQCMAITVRQILGSFYQLGGMWW